MSRQTSRKSPVSSAPLKPSILALEPRWMYDAAVVDSAATSKQTADVATATETHTTSDTTPVTTSSTTATETAKTVEATSTTEKTVAATSADTSAADKSSAYVIVRAADTAVSGGKLEIVFVDAAVQDWQKLVSEIKSGPEVVLIQTNGDGLGQIADFLSTQHDVSAIHIISNGNSGVIELAGQVITASNINNYASDLKSIGNAIQNGGDILLYGCNIGGSAEGSAFVSEIAALTGRDVAASTDVTGAAVKGGDWTLETAAGTIETKTLFADAAPADWNHDLTTTYIQGTKLASGDTDDTVYGTVNIGFSFNFYGTNYTSCYVTSNGVVEFGSSSSAYSNTALSSAGISNAIFAFWDDLYQRTSLNSDITTKTVTSGSAGNPYGHDIFIIQWTNYGFYSSSSLPMGTFQVILIKDTNQIVLNYRALSSTTGGNADSHGASATIGVAYSTTRNTQYSYNTSAVYSGQAITYTYNSGTGNYTQSTANSTDYLDTLLYWSSVAPPGTFAETSPGSASTGVSVAPTFTWDAASGATSYTLIVSTNANLSSPAINVTGLTSTSYTPGTSLAGNTTYYWEVIAVNSGGSTYGTELSFTTGSSHSVSLTVPGSQSFTDNSYHSIATTFSDVNPGSTATATITSNNGGLLKVTTAGGLTVTGNSSSSLSLSGSPSVIATALSTLQYAASLSASGSETVSISVTDGTATTSKTISVSLTANDTPTVTVPGTQNDSLSTNFSISGISVADSRSGTLTATVSDLYGIIDVTQGTGSATITNNDTSSVTISGTLANINAALATLAYRTNLTAAGTDRITVSINDGGSSLIGGAKSASGSITVNVLANDTPVIAVPASQSDRTAGSYAISGVAISDSYSGSSVSASLSASNGTLSVTAGSATVTGNGTGALSISGTLSAVNAALATLGYTTTVTATGDDTIALSVNDGGSNRIGGAKSATASIGVHLTGNDAPTVTVGGTQTISDTAQHSVSGVSVSDSINGNSLTASISASYGNVYVTSGSGATISGSGTGTVTVTGTQTQVNATLATLKYATTATGTTADTISVSVNDNYASGIGGSKTTTRTIAVNLIGNSAPVVSSAAAMTIYDASAHGISSLAVTDSSVGTAVTAQVTSVSGALDFTGSGITYNNGGHTSVTITAANVTALNAILATMTYTATSSTTASDTVTLTVNDGGAGSNLIGGNKTATKTVDISLIANDTPRLLVPASQTIADQNAHAVSGFAIEDSRATSVTATLTATNGVLDLTSATGVTVSGNGTGTLVISGSTSLVNAALANLTYQTATNLDDAIVLSVTDSGTAEQLVGGSKTATASVSVDFVNDIPSLSVNISSSALAVNTTDPVAISGISFSDSLHDSVVEVTVAAAHGLLNATASGSVVISGNGSNSMTLSGDLADMNAVLTTLTYTTVATSTDGDSLTVTVNDQLSGNPRSATATVDIAMTGNTAPVLDTPSPLSVSTTSAVSMGFGSTTIADDATGSSVHAVVSSTSGLLNLTASGATVGGNGTTTVTLDGTVSQVNAALATMTYTAGMTTTGADTVTLAVNDNGAAAHLIGGDKQTTGAVDVNVIANTAPTIALPGDVTVDATSAHAITGIAITDADIGTAVSVTVGVNHGSLSFGTASSGTATATDNGNGTWTVSGNVADVNTVLNSLAYTTSLTASGVDTLSVSISDDGVSTNLIGGSKTASGSFALNVFGNDTPVVQTGIGQTYSDTLSHAISGVSIDDSSTGASVHVVVSDSVGTLSMTGGAGSATITSSNGGKTITLDGSLADVNAALATLTYTAATSGDDAISISIDDQNTAAVGGAKTGSGSIAVTVIGNDSPVVTTGVGQTFTNTAQHAISGVSASDIFSGTTLTATVSASHGTIHMTANGGGATITDDGTGTVTVSATSMSDINLALSTLAYTTTASSTTTDTITVSINDGGSALVGGAKTSSATIAISLTGNDTPSVTVPADVSVSDNLSHVFSGLTLTDGLSGSSLTATISVLHGTLAATAGAGSATIGGANGSSLTISGSVADINAALATLNYATTLSASGSDTVSISVNDGGTALIGGAKTTSRSFGVTVVENAAASITVPAAQTFYDTDAHAVTGIGFTDSLHGATMTATVTATSGHLNVTDDRTTNVGGNGSSSMTIEGTLANVNAVLATLTYTATTAGSDTITVSVNDGGSALIGGAKTDQRTIAVTVVPNDTPVLSLPGAQSFVLGQSSTNPVAGLSIADTLSGTTVSATVSDLTGELRMTASGAANVTRNSATSLTVTGSLADVNASLASLTYGPTIVGDDVITVAINDGGTHRVGGTKSAGGTINVLIVAIPSPLPPADAQGDGGSGQPGTGATDGNSGSPSGTGQTSSSGDATLGNISNGSGSGLGDQVLSGTKSAFDSLGSSSSGLGGSSSGTGGTSSTTGGTSLQGSGDTGSGNGSGTGTTSAATRTGAQAASPAETANGSGLAYINVARSETGRANGGTSAADGATLVLFKPIEFVQANGNTLLYRLPSDTFVERSPDASVHLHASLADGSPLPEWVRFDPITGTFSGVAPEGVRVLQIRVVATDSHGSKAETVFDIRIGKQDREGALHNHRIKAAVPAEKTIAGKESGHNRSATGGKIGLTAAMKLSTPQQDVLHHAARLASASTPHKS